MRAQLINLETSRPRRAQIYTPEQKARRAAQSAARYRARRAVGVCVYPGCGNRTNGTVYCDECREVERLRKMAYREARET